VALERAHAKDVDTLNKMLPPVPYPMGPPPPPPVAPVAAIPLPGYYSEGAMNRGTKRESTSAYLTPSKRR
jgi:hypothetical protein